MADAYEQNLAQKADLTISDYIRVVGTDNNSYKQPMADVAQKIVEDYAGSTLAGSAQSVKVAIDGLKSTATADKAELESDISTVASNLATETSTRTSQDANLQAQINQLVAPSGEAPSTAEIENARIGDDNVTYSTLGEAIRTQFSNVKSDISGNRSAIISGTYIPLMGELNLLEGKLWTGSAGGQIGTSDWAGAMIRNNSLQNFGDCDVTITLSNSMRVKIFEVDTDGTTIRRDTGWLTSASSYTFNSLYTYAFTFSKSGTPNITSADVRANCFIDARTKINEFEDAVGELEECKSDLCDASDRIWSVEETASEVTYSIGTPVFKHIGSNGSISSNSNKNVTFDYPVKALKGSTVYVDEGYKYQLGIYNLSGTFIERITWLYGNNIFTFDDDYLVRVEISDNNESQLSDFSILEHLHYNLVKSKKNRINAVTAQLHNIVEGIGTDNLKRKVFTVAEPSKYQAWSFVVQSGTKLICLYSVGDAHEDNSGFDVYMQTSYDGVVWSDRGVVFSTGNVRDNITGKGYDYDNGKTYIWLRQGAPGNSDTVFKLYEHTDDGFVLKSSPAFEVVCGHIGDIIYNPDDNSLIAFFNTYGNSRSWGYVKSVDGGATWTQTVVESDLSIADCPVEMSGAYLGNGRYLVMGRKDNTSGTVAMFQIESSDNGTTWTKAYSNIDDVNGSTPSVVLQNDVISLYYYHRGAGDLRLRKERMADVFNNPTNWSWGNFEILASGAAGQDAGNVNACDYNEYQVATYYSGNSINTGIYDILV